MVNLIGAHMSRNGVAKDWPTRGILSYGGNGLGEQHPDTIVVFRSPGIAERPSDLYTNPAPMADIARYWYDKQFKPLFVAITATYPDNPIYFVLTSEACGTDEHEVVTHISYERELCKLAKVDGFKCGIGKLANGTPEWDSGLWQRYYAPWIVEAWNDYGAIYLRHVYGGDLVNTDGSISKAYPFYPYRVIDELQVLQSLGWKGGLFMAECGLDGGYGKADWNRFVFQITKFEQTLRPYADNVIGFAWWECGATNWGADYTSELKQMTGYMSENSLPKWEGGTAVQPPTEPPTGTTEEKIFQISQAWAFPVNEDAALQKVALADGFTPSGAEAWHEVGGVKYAMQPFYKIGDTNNKRSYYAVVGEWNDVMWTDGTISNGAFAFTHWPTPHRTITQEFLANPQSYTQFGLPGHDGVDVRAYHGDPVFSVADGVVTDIIPLSANHNYGLAIRVQHADDYQTTYAHLKQTVRSVGEAVKGGDIVGLADNTGNSSGDHLHLTLKKVGYPFTDRCGNLWPYDICDPTPSMVHFDGVAWPGGSPGFDCPGMEPPPPTGSKIDLLPYLMGDGRLYEVRNSSGGQERFQSQDKGADEFWQTKNSLAEQMFTDSGCIYRGWDTSPGNGRYYVQQQNGKQFAQWLPRMMAVNEVFTTSLKVQFYDWNCQPSAENSGNVTDTRRLVAHHPVWTSPYGITLNDVVQLEWVNGGETYYYAKNFGLVGWGRTHNDPNTPASSAISEIHAPGQRPDNVVSLPDCLT